MPTLDEVLKAAGVKDEVISGLPKELTTALTGYVAQAETKLTAAQQAEADAAEKLRVAQLTDDEVKEYVEKYGASLNEIVALKAERDAYKTAVESVKKDGINIDLKLPTSTTEPVVPGSPARGANAVTFDPEKFAGQVGSTMAAFLDANNEHIRLFGTPIPDSAETLAQEARNARKPLNVYAAERYKFADAKKARETADFQKKVDEAAQAKIADKERELAEKYGSNPGLRSGESSRASLMPKIKSDDFHKSDGNKPRRERLGSMLDKIHQEIAANSV